MRHYSEGLSAKDMNQASRIQWIVDGVFGSEDAGYRSTLASNRYRAIIPAEALKQRGIDVQYVQVSRWEPDKHTCGKADVVCIGKLAPGDEPARLAQLSERVLNGVRACVQAGVAVIADFNDDHFERPDVGGYWRTLARLCSLGVAGSPEMQKVLAQYTDAPVAVIGDPTGSPWGEPRVFRAASVVRWVRLLGAGGKQRLHLVWYGNLNNWTPMQRWLERLAEVAVEQPWMLRVVTSPDERLTRILDEFNARHGPRALVEFVEWSEAEQWALVGQSDIVLIPSDATSQRKVVKTSNRLTDALYAGRYVVASPLPAYLPYKNYVALTDDPLPAIRAYLADPDSCLRVVREGQARVQSEVSAEHVAERWLLACAEAREHIKAPVFAKPHGPSSDSSAAQLRLNLGCGDKILPGYVNVDVVASRAGKAPDVICDLHQLHPFENDSVDEVMAVHVVEHFWRWEVEAVLREWIRVLKPGGRMVLECPNLRSACEAFLADPETAASADVRGQRTMWVFYGDPQWQDPLMVHRWGYTPQSLGALMAAVGLTGIRQEPAQYKLREPRDMRLVGIKPLPSSPQ